MSRSSHHHAKNVMKVNPSERRDRPTGYDRNYNFDIQKRDFDKFYNFYKMTMSKALPRQNTIVTNNRFDCLARSKSNQSTMNPFYRIVERIYTGDVNTRNHDQRELEPKNHPIFVKFWESLSYNSEQYMKLFKGAEYNTAEYGQPPALVLLPAWEALYVSENPLHLCTDVWRNHDGKGNKSKSKETLDQHQNGLQ